MNHRHRITLKINQHWGLLWMLICKWPDGYLQEAGSSWWSFARDRILWMFICKRLGPPDDHLQVAWSSGWSFARGRILRMIICHHLSSFGCPPNSPLSDDVIHEQPLKCNHICIETTSISFPLLSRPTTLWFGNLACPARPADTIRLPLLHLGSSYSTAFKFEAQT